ncbi:PLP-dependent transferase [Mycena belliarum]|uniref:PLP-dependent transferase n=1 Tax=Mycena belliarum TaxID=1033014 RepID=A0AAD6XTI3_9AGAR|nr:PLP-dependent transferase [Mycena belliae]
MSSLKSAVIHKTPVTPPLAVTAKGIRIYIEDGREIIDAIGGAAVACIGSGHPKVVEAICEQAKKLQYTFHPQLTNEPTELLSTYVTTKTGTDVFAYMGFAAGGTEAVESAIKTARQYFYEQGQTQRVHFIGREVSYHGASYGTIALAYNTARRAPYEGQLDTKTFHHVGSCHYKRFKTEGESSEKFIERRRQELEAKFLELGPDTVIAYVAETIVGASSGVVLPPTGYYAAMKSVCDKYGALLIYDEVMCGMGRSGHYHAWQALNEPAPDIQAIAKGLGAGYAPIGAILASKKVIDGMRAGPGVWQHGYTYQAHPISSAASLAVQQVIAEEGLLANIQKQGALLGRLLEEGLYSRRYVKPFVFDIRGVGGFWAVEFDSSATINNVEVTLALGGKRLGPLIEAKCMQQGNMMIFGMSGGGSLDGTVGDHCMFAPAFNVTEDEIRLIADIFVNAVESVIDAGVTETAKAVFA